MDGGAGRLLTVGVGRPSSERRARRACEPAAHSNLAGAFQAFALRSGRAACHRAGAQRAPGAAPARWPHVFMHWAALHLLPRGVPRDKDLPQAPPAVRPEGAEHRARVRADDRRLPGLQREDERVHLRERPALGRTNGGRSFRLGGGRELVRQVLWLQPWVRGLEFLGEGRAIPRCFAGALGRRSQLRGSSRVDRVRLFRRIIEESGFWFRPVDTQRHLDG